MQKLTNILQTILGSKSKVSILRNVIKTPGIAARNIETKSGMSWGAIRPAVDHLVSIGIINREDDGWANHLYLNTDHLLAKPLKQLFNAERRLTSSLFRQIKKESMSIDHYGVVSIIMDHDEMVLYVVLQDRGYADELLDSLEAIASLYQFKIIKTTVEKFMRIHGEKKKSFSVITGEKPPFKSLREKLKFFDFE